MDKLMVDEKVEPVEDEEPEDKSPVVRLSGYGPADLLPRGMIAELFGINPGSLDRACQERRFPRPVVLFKRSYWSAGVLRSWIEGKHSGLVDQDEKETKSLRALTGRN